MTGLEYIDELKKRGVKSCESNYNDGEWLPYSVEFFQTTEPDFDMAAVMENAYKQAEDEILKTLDDEQRTAYRARKEDALLFHSS